MLASVWVLQTFGYSVSGLVASLGLGGLAVALAIQPILANIFASLTIFTDRPFIIGDFIQIGDVIGTVEEVGVRSTRIRTLGKSLVTIPNNEISNSRIDNLSRRPMRRVKPQTDVLTGSGCITNRHADSMFMDAKLVSINHGIRKKSLHFQIGSLLVCEGLVKTLNCGVWDW